MALPLRCTEGTRLPTTVEEEKEEVRVLKAERAMGAQYAVPT